MIRGSLCAVLSVVFLCPGAGAGVDAAGQTGSLGGSVRAPDGSRLPGVVVSIEGGEAAPLRLASTAAGLFFFADLPEGSRTLTAQLDGFTTRTVSVRVEAGRHTEVDLVLELAMVEEHIDVVGTGPRDAMELTAIRDRAARDVADATMARPGIMRLRKGAIAGDIVVRGLQSRDLTVVIDGQRVQGACPNHMDPPSFHVDLAEVQRIEVAKGPFDVKHQGSLGGVVNVVTQRPAAGWRGLINLGVGTAAYINPAATASFGGRAWSMLGGGSWRRADAYRDGNDRLFTAVANYRPDALDLAAFSVGTGWGRLAWTPTPAQTLQLSYTRQDAGLVLYPYLQMDAINDDADRIGARYESADAPGALGAVAAQAYYTRVTHWMTDAHRLTAGTATRGWSMGTDAKTDTWGGRAEGRWGGLSVGTEVARRRWNTTTQMAGMQYVPQRSLADATHTAAGLFGEVSRPLSATATLEAGVRVDWVGTRVDDTGANVALFRAYHGVASTSRDDVLGSGKARLKWLLPGGVTVAGGVGRSMRSPDQQERYFALKRSGMDWVGDPGLAPVTNTGLEGEVEFVRRRLRVAANVFDWWLDDFVVVRGIARQTAVPGVMNTRARTFANVDARMRGAELDVSVPLARRMFVTGTGSWLRGTERTDESADLAEIPPARGTAALSYDDGRVNAAIEVIAVARQDHVDTSLGEQPTPGYTVVNARTGFKVSRLRVTIGLDNLLDRAYYEHLSYQRDPFRNGTRVFEPGLTLFANATVGF